MSQWIAGGIKTVTTPGTPVQLTTSNIQAHAILIQALSNNTARVVVGQDNTVRANATVTNPSGSVLAILGRPSSNSSTPPSVQYDVTNSPGGVLLSQFWIDAETTTEGVIWSYSLT